MKVVIALLLSSFFSLQAAEVKKTTDKVYNVPVSKPQIDIGGDETDENTVYEKNRPRDPFYLALQLSHLSFDLPALTTNTSTFKQNIPGIIAGKRINNRLYFRGQLEISGAWQRFERTSGLYKQQLNLLKLNFIQNINLLWSFRNAVFFTGGAGVAPAFLTVEKSTIGNSLSKFTVAGILQLNALYPLSRHYEIDLGLKGSWGSIDGEKIFLSTLSLGLNFE